MITLSKFITEYLSYCEYRKRLNFKTLKSYRIDLNQYLAFCDNSTRLPHNKILLSPGTSDRVLRGT